MPEVFAFRPWQYGGGGGDVSAKVSPPYDVLDDVLEMLIDREASVSDVVAKGHDREMVKKVERLIYLSEYKRFQSAPGARLTQGAFWLDRRYPIVNRFRDGSAR